MSEFGVLDFALALSRRGLSVIPVPRPVPGTRKGRPGDGKVPAIAWKAYQECRPTEDELRAWFATDQNLAIITGGVSGIVVVDVDSADAVAWAKRNLPRTPWRVKTARGLHLYYRHTGVVVRNRARIETKEGRLAIDVRADGGYVIGPSSVHAEGHVYAAEGDWSVAVDKLPAFWPGWLERPRRHLDGVSTSRSTARRPTGDISTRARAYLRAIPTPVIGQGSDAATFSAACRLVRGFGLDSATAIDLLQEWAPSFDRWWLEAKVESALKYGEEPIEGLR